MKLTIKEYAAEQRVSERTVYNWIEKGAIAITRTPGGRIRIPSPSQYGNSRVIILQNSEVSGNSSE